MFRYCRAFAKRASWVLKQAAREWSGKLGKTLKGLGFEQSLIDPCVFRLMDGDEVRVLIVFHIDDMFVVGTETVQNKLAEDLNVHFLTKNLGELVWYAGCEYRHDLEKGTLKLSQPAYIQRILDRFSINRTATTPALFVLVSRSTTELISWGGTVRRWDL